MAIPWEQKSIGGAMPDALAVLPHPIGRILAVRGICTAKERDAFLFPQYERDIASPWLFHAMQATVDRLIRAKKSGERIGIYGDYDADGVCGATLLKTVCDDLGIVAEVYIPHKEKDGHGLSLLAIDHFTKNGVTLIVTVDCGITNIMEIATAKELGIETIVIDHHHVPEILPDAVAVINPKLPNSGYPFADLCGTGTAFKVACALYARLAPDRQAQTKWLLDLVAIATVADMMPLVGENRTLVRFGLIVLQHARRVGLRALCAVGRIPVSASQPPTAQTIGFHIAPRINAAGRMGHAKDAHALLIATDMDEACKCAEALEALNTERRRVAESITKNARAAIHAQASIPAGIVIGHEDYFHGVVGLAAGRLAEEFERPVGVFHHRGEFSIGSFRSRSGIHIVDVLTQCDAFLVKYGGHAAAAGATVRRDAFDAFAIQFAKVVASRSSAVSDTSACIMVDAAVRLTDITPTCMDYFRHMEPCGMGNPEPLLAFHKMIIESIRIVGKTGAHIKCVFRDSADRAVRIDGIGFSLAESVASFAPGDAVTVIGVLQENYWQGQRVPQIAITKIFGEGQSGVAI